MLFGGRLIASGTPEEMRNSDNEAVRQLLEGRTHGPLTGE